MAIKVYNYTDDVGNELPIRMDETKAAIGGFTEGTAVSGVMGPTPLNRVRGVYARGANGTSIFIPCATQGQALFVSTNSKSINYKGNTYNTVSSRGEKRLHGSATLPD